MPELLHTPLHDLNVELGAKMVPFAGYAMPVQYTMGIMQEHIHTRVKAGLFDVSHMGQVIITGDDYASAALALEALIPIDILGLQQDRQRYGFFTNNTGGIMDDLMIANRGDHIFIVVNAVCKAADIGHMKSKLNGIKFLKLLIAHYWPCKGRPLKQSWRSLTRKPLKCVSWMSPR